MGRTIGKEKPSSEYSLIFRATIPRPRVRLLSRLLVPIARIKRILDALYARILAMVWEELRGSSAAYSEAANLAAFLILCGFAWTFHYLREYSEIAIVGSIALWCADALVNRKPPREDGRSERIELECPVAGALRWTRVDASGELDRLEIDPAAALRIDVERQRHFRGAFDEIASDVWCVSLALDDGGALTLDEQNSPGPALQRARRIAERLVCPLEFASSDSGMSPGSSTPVSVAEQAERWRVELRASGSEHWALLRRTLSESGFLLFYLVMFGVLLRFGSLIHTLVAPHFGLSAPTLIIDLSPAGILGFFRPEASWFSLAGFATALSVILSKWLELRRPWKIELSGRQTVVSRGRRIVGSFHSQELKVVVLTEPSPSLLLFDWSGRAYLLDEISLKQARGLCEAIETARGELLGQEP